MNGNHRKKGGNGNHRKKGGTEAAAGGDGRKEEARPRVGGKEEEVRSCSRGVAKQSEMGCRTRGVGESRSCNNGELKLSEVCLQWEGHVS